jgi:hypothetical protein
LVVEGLSAEKTAIKAVADISLVKKLIHRMESNKHKGEATKIVNLFD